MPQIPQKAGRVAPFVPAFFRASLSSTKMKPYTAQKKSFTAVAHAQYRMDNKKFNKKLISVYFLQLQLSEFQLFPHL